MLLSLEGKILGFDQDALDELYAKYDDLTEIAPEVDEDATLERFDALKAKLVEMENANHSITLHAKGFGNFYTLWGLIALTGDLPATPLLAERYSAFMGHVAELAVQDDLQAFLQQHQGPEYALALTYLSNSRGASTDLAQRVGRLEALRAAVV
jgi:hypothetical protein